MLGTYHLTYGVLQKNNVQPRKHSLGQNAHHIYVTDFTTLSLTFQYIFFLLPVTYCYFCKKNGGVRGWESRNPIAATLTTLSRLAVYDISVVPRYSEPHHRPPPQERKVMLS